MAHCIASCTGTSHFMGVGTLLESNTTIGDLVGGLGTIARLHKTENLCRVIARRAGHGLDGYDSNNY